MTAQTNTLKMTTGLFNPVVFMETLRRSWRGMLWWGIGLGSLAWVQIVAVPSVDSVQQLTNLLQTMPPALLQMFGAGDMQFMATVTGYLALQLFAFFPLVFAIYGVICGLNVTSSDEDRGIMDMFLSTPVNRMSVIVSKSLAYVLLIIAVILWFFAGVWAGLLMTPEISAEVNLGAMFAATLAMIAPVLVVFAFTVMLTGLLRNRGLSIGLVSVLIIASYFLDTLGKSASGSILNTLRPLSYSAWYDYQGILQNGMMWGNLIVLLVVTLILIVVGMVGFQRRDVGV